ncbi:MULTISPECIES: serine/threonine-protein kinase [Clostridia]|jgi:serine/threonine protein kinase|uniref:serine/threonine-protein kinase n=2 Tax=Bacillota TaxID=1239 RepID=UPI0018ABE1A0|nr:serine/threonine-protein kinase [Clostridium sp. 1001270J_160509_D11]
MLKENIIILLEEFKNGLLDCATNGTFSEQEYKKMREQILEIDNLKSHIPIFLKVQRTPNEFRRYMQGLYGNYAGRRKFITDEINKLILVVEESKEVELSSNDEYTIGERLGNGGFGQVYKYHNELLDLDFAIKVLDPLFSSEKDQANSEKRFFREAKMLFTLCHPNIVRIYDVGRLEGKPFIKMELVEGCDMNGLLKKHGNLTFENSLLPIIELLKGLEYAHHKGIIHRDLKPSNYMYSETCGYKIIDFGISAFTESEGYTKLTKTGEQIAGGLYTDPQLMENPTLRDCRSDIYSVGAIWHFLLTGRAPSGGDMRKNLIKNYNLDEDKTDLIIRCLAYKLEDRYNNCLELRKILESL